MSNTFPPSGVWRLLGAACCLSFSLSSHGVLAQPDAGELLREIERKDQPELPAEPVPQARPDKPVEPEGLQVLVEQFVFEGHSRLSKEQLDDVVEPWLNRELTLPELQQVADQVAERYRQAGYLARVYLPAQDVKDGSIRIVIIEARLGEVKVDDGGEKLRLADDYARETVAERQGAGEILGLKDIERGIQLLDDTPGVSARSVLAPGEEDGHTDIIVSVSDEPLFRGSVGADNFGSRSTGEERLNASLSLDNPTGHGDQAQFTGLVSEGSTYGRLRYSLPIGRDGLRAGASVSHYQYELGEEYDILEAQGDATTFGLDVQYPLIRESLKNINLISRLDYRAYENEQLGRTTSDKDVTALTLGVSGDATDGYGGGGINFYGASLVAGRLDLSGNAIDYANDQMTAQRHGTFSKLAWNLGRLQRLEDRTTLWLSLRGQFAGDNLDSSEGFSLGGPGGVRAYPVLEGSGDEGWLSTVEVRHRLTSEVTAMAFYDHGGVRQYKDEWTGWNAADPTQPLNFQLKGAGVGAVWAKPGRFNVSLVMAHRIGSNPLADPVTGNDSDGTSDKTRLWLNATHYF